MSILRNRSTWVFHLVRLNVPSAFLYELSLPASLSSTRPFFWRSWERKLRMLEGVGVSTSPVWTELTCDTLSAELANTMPVPPAGAVSVPVGAISALGPVRSSSTHPPAATRHRLANSARDQVRLR